MVPTTTHPFHGLWKSTTNAAFALIAGAAVFCTAPGTARATVMTTCNDSSFCTLQELYDGGTITVNDKLFDNWFASGDGDWDAIEVHGIETGNVGISFRTIDGLAPPSGDEIALEIDFVVTPSGGWLIKDNTLELIEFVDDDGYISIFEDVFADPFGAQDLIGEKFVDTDNPPDSLFDSADFPPQPEIGVNLDILIQSFIGQDSGEAALYQFDLRFSQIQPVPEPGAMAMFAVGLAGLGFLRRRRKA